MKKWLLFVLSLQLLACEKEEALSPDAHRALNHSILAWQKGDFGKALATLDAFVAEHGQSTPPSVRELRRQYEAEYRDRYAPARSYYLNRTGVAAAVYDDITLYYQKHGHYPATLDMLEVTKGMPPRVLQSCLYKKAEVLDAGFILHCQGASTEAEIHEAESGIDNIWSHYESRFPPANDFYQPPPISDP